MFIADVRDWLNSDELQRAATWGRAELNDEVLDRIHAELHHRHEHLDSPSAALHAPAPSLDAPA